MAKEGQTKTWKIHASMTREGQTKTWKIHASMPTVGQTKTWKIQAMVHVAQNVTPREVVQDVDMLAVSGSSCDLQSSFKHRASPIIHVNDAGGIYCEEQGSSSASVSQRPVAPVPSDGQNSSLQKPCRMLTPP